MHAGEAARRRAGLRTTSRAIEGLALLLSENGAVEELALDAIRRLRRIVRIAEEIETAEAMDRAQHTLDRVQGLLETGARLNVSSLEFFISVLAGFEPESSVEAPSDYSGMHEAARRLTRELAPRVHTSDIADPTVRALGEVHRARWSVKPNETQGIATVLAMFDAQRAILRTTSE